MSSSEPATTEPPVLEGDVYTPSHPDYLKILKSWNQRYSHVHPAIINVVKKPDHVRLAILYARYYRLSVRIKSGGHSYEGFSVVEDGLVIDLRDLKELTIDPVSKTCRFGAGWLQGDLYSELRKRGFVIAGGICDTVATVPVFLGGGTGIFHRLWGLSCDTLTGVSLVTHSGMLLQCDKDRNADLFWACKGAGNGNFGVAVAATVRLFPATQVFNFLILWPWDQRVPFFWQQWLEKVTPKVASVTLQLGDYTSVGKPERIECKGIFAGDFEGCRAVVESLLQLVPVHPQKVCYQEESPEEAGDLSRGASLKDPRREWAAEAELLFEASRWKSTGLLSMNILGPDDIQVLGDLLAEAPRTMAGFSVAFVGLGGQIDAVGPGATAYPHRGARFMLRIVGRWADPRLDEPHLQFHRRVKEDLARRTGSNRYYFNYCDLEIPDFLKSYYGENVERLQRVKGTYDPEPFFCYPQSIPPLRHAGSDQEAR